MAAHSRSSVLQVRCLGGEGDHLADVAVVDRCPRARSVDAASSGSPSVEARRRARAAGRPRRSAVGDAVAGVEREADDLDRDADLGAFPFVVVVVRQPRPADAGTGPVRHRPSSVRPGPEPGWR